MDSSPKKKHTVVLVLAGLVWLAVAGVIAWTVLDGGDDPTGDTASATATPAQETSAPAESSPDVDNVAIDDEPASPDQDKIVRIAVPLANPDDPDGDASGDVDFALNPATGEVCYSVTSEAIEGPYRSHIHAGGPGVQGGIVVDLGPLESGAIGCVDNLPVDTNAVLGDLDGHYAELHDVSETFTLRGQLSDAEGGDDTTDAPDGFDPDGGGARILLEEGTVRLEGPVADQKTADGLAGLLGGLDPSTPVINDLEIVAGAPLPTGTCVIADRVFFQVNSDQVRQIDDATLAAIVGLARSLNDGTLTVVGHTDSSGSDVYNLELSLRRAAALRDLLAAEGLPAENLRIRGAGETAPIGDNNTGLGRARNRRIEFEFTHG